MQEYESDELASNSEDEKKIRKAKLSAEKKRKDSKVVRAMLLKSLNLLAMFSFFAVRSFIFLCDVSRWVGLPEHPTIFPLVLHF